MPFPSTQVYHGVGIIANKREQSYKQRSKRSEMLLFLLQVKKHAWAGTMSTWEIHT